MFMFKTRICEVLATTVAIYLEAVEQAQFVYCYHARLVCGVMAHLLLSATMGARSVELLTKWRGFILGGIGRFGRRRMTFNGH